MTLDELRLYDNLLANGSPKAKETVIMIESLWLQSEVASIIKAFNELRHWRLKVDGAEYAGKVNAESNEIVFAGLLAEPSPLLPKMWRPQKRAAVIFRFYENRSAGFPVVINADIELSGDLSETRRWQISKKMTLREAFALPKGSIEMEGIELFSEEDSQF